MNFLDDFLERINDKQKIVISIIVPLILFIISYTIANQFGGTNYNYIGGTSFTTYGGSPFEVEDTWLIWVIFLSIIGYLEYKIWG